MLKTAEYVSLGHPDKTADYISSYILDRMLEQNTRLRYAVEVMLKDNTIVLGGEICGNLDMNQLGKYVKEALAEIGYTEEYAQRFKQNALEPQKLKIINLIGNQSAQIGQGVDDGGWGDQGVFVGYACQGEAFMPSELYLAKKLNNALYEKAKKSQTLGLDIKTQITIDEKQNIITAVVAIPMLEPQDLTTFIVQTLGQRPQELIVNGTGSYVCHSSIADCGITGRKLAVDFYETACPIGGGSPWTKDASKADVSLNLMARRLAVANLKDNDEAFVYLSSCIGRSQLPSAVLKTVQNGHASYKTLEGDFRPKSVIEHLGLNKPVFAKLCREGFVW